MERIQLIDLFKKYLNRSPSEEEISRHQIKKYAKFENEILKCKEYLELQKTPKHVEKTVKRKGKIAILISGHIRNNNINKSFGHLSDYDYDVFIHTWDNFGFKGSETNL